MMHHTNQRAMRERYCAFAITAILGLSGAAIANAQCSTEEIAKLLGSGVEEGDRFGEGVAISGDTVVIGSPRDDDAALDAGAAYIFQDDGAGNWIEIANLVAGDGATNDQLGEAVAIDGDTAVIATIRHGGGTGAAYIFRDDGAGNWAEIDKLVAADSAPDQLFGCSVAISGDTIIVGSRFNDETDNQAGAAYVFQDDGAGNFTQVQKLLASDGDFFHWFGDAVAIEGEIALIGAPNANLTGTAYVFEDDGSGNWTEIQKLNSIGGIHGDDFGESVAISGDTFLISAPGDGPASTGAAYVFVDDGTGSWVERDKLRASDAGGGDAYGFSVAIAGDLAVVGAFHDDDFGNATGAAYFYRRIAPGAWIELEKLLASDAAAGDHFGRSLALSGMLTVIGAYRDDDRGPDTGSAYLFSLCPDIDVDAIVTDATFVIGQHVSGVHADLRESDDFHIRGRSSFGFSAQEANILDLVTGVVSFVPTPSTFDLTVESRIDNPGGLAKLRLRNWGSNAFDEIAMFRTTQIDSTAAFEDLEATTFFRTTDGRMEVSVRMTVVATFSAQGFNAYFDLVHVAPQ